VLKKAQNNSNLYSLSLAANRGVDNALWAQVIEAPETNKIIVFRRGVAHTSITG